MSKFRHEPPLIRGKGNQRQEGPKEVESLFDIMKDGAEFQSIVGAIPRNGNLVPDLLKAVTDIEAIRKCPCICYIANVVNPEMVGIEIDFSDDLPFKEMVTSAPEANEIDVFIVTPGGIGSQVPNFVSTLRAKYRRVNFIIPYMCMSAGTLFVLSGNRIFMDSRGFIGPIDPQVRLKSGEYVPAQSVLHLLEKIKEEGNAAIAQGKNVPWHFVRLLDNMDPRQIGDAYTSSEYSIKLAKEFLIDYKFMDWVKHKSTGQAVTKEEKEAAANQISDLLCANNYWKSHSHGITRDIANREVKLYIDNVESIPGLERAVRRSWAMFSYALERAPMKKIFISGNYLLFRLVPNAGGGKS